MRQLHNLHLHNRDEILRGLINNLRKCLHLIRAIQALGITSLPLCVLCIFLIDTNRVTCAEIIFGTGLLKGTVRFRLIQKNPAPKRQEPSSSAH
ncbi:DUF2721 domain-containing protein [Tichowtungia aerotolerans]|uniref:DUF2721 domain-containing protein n=1 Tax=Tichowtungia aerotolerans TaxID=2697043 RepID=UPI0038CD1AFC